MGKYFLLDYDAISTNLMPLGTKPKPPQCQCLHLTNKAVCSQNNLGYFHTSVCMFYLKPALDVKCLLARIASVGRGGGLTRYEHDSTEKEATIGSQFVLMSCA